MWVKRQQTYHRCELPWDMDSKRMGANGTAGDIWQCNFCLKKWTIITVGPDAGTRSWTAYDVWQHSWLRVFPRTWHTVRGFIGF